MALAIYGSTEADGSGIASSMTHDSGSGSDRYLVVGLEHRGTPTISGVTYNGVAMSPVGTVNSPGSLTQVSLWELDNPASGSNLISVSSSGSAIRYGITATTFEGADTSVGASGTGSGTSDTGSAAVTTTAVDSFVYAIAAWRGGDTDPLTATSPSVLIDEGGSGSNANNGLGYAAAYRAATSTGSYSVEFNASSNDEYAIIAVEIKEAGAGGGGGFPVHKAPQIHMLAGGVAVQYPGSNVIYLGR